MAHVRADLSLLSYYKLSNKALLSGKAAKAMRQLLCVSG
jgi:hypothetical protein